MLTENSNQGKFEQITPELPEEIKEELIAGRQRAEQNAQNSDYMFGLARSGSVAFESFLGYERKTNNLELPEGSNITTHLLIGRELISPIIIRKEKEIAANNRKLENRDRRTSKLRSKEPLPESFNSLGSDEETDKIVYEMYFKSIKLNARQIINEVKSKIIAKGKDINIDIFDDCLFEGATAALTATIFTIALHELGYKNVNFTVFDPDSEDTNSEMNKLSNGIRNFSKPIKRNNGLEANARFHLLLQDTGWKNTLIDTLYPDNDFSFRELIILKEIITGYSEVVDTKNRTYNLQETSWDILKNKYGEKLIANVQNFLSTTNLGGNLKNIKEHVYDLLKR